MSTIADEGHVKDTPRTTFDAEIQCDHDSAVPINMASVEPKRVVSQKESSSKNL